MTNAPFTIFQTDDLTEYLKFRLGADGKRTGQKRKAALFLNCHTALISQVLGGQVKLSLEYAHRLNDFFEHTPLEVDYFLLLVQKDRAGTTELANYFQEKMRAIQLEQNNIKKRISASKTILKEDQHKFYSSWVYGACHILSSLPSVNGISELSEKLCIPKRQAQQVLNFLLRIGLVKKVNNTIEMGPGHVHLGSHSKLVQQHHSNWRLLALNRMQDERGVEDLHYSGAVSMSYEDAAKIRNLLIQALKENIEIIRASKAEQAYVYNFDFFRLG